MSMDNMNWFGGILRKFEYMCSEMDDIMWQEKFQYMENQLQTAGANVKQFCSEVLQEVLPQSFVGVAEGVTDDSTSGQRIDEVNIVEEQSEKEFQPSSVKSVQAEKRDLSLEEDTVNGGITENCSELLEDDSLTKITPSTLDESCIIVDKKDQTSVSLEAAREGSCKEKIKVVLALRRKASGGSLLQEEEKGSAASSNATSNHEIWLSDWEII